MRKLVDMTEPEIRDLLNLMGALIVKAAEASEVEKPLFALLLFNDPKLGQYCSNAERKDIIKALRETADRLDKRQDVPR